MKHQIVHVVREFPKYSEQFIRLQVNYLAKSGVNCRIVCDKYNSSLAQKIDINQDIEITECLKKRVNIFGLIVLTSLGLIRTIGFMSFIKLLWTEHRNLFGKTPWQYLYNFDFENCDLVHFQYFTHFKKYSPVISVLAMLDKKIVMSVRGADITKRLPSVKTYFNKHQLQVGMFLPVSRNFEKRLIELGVASARISIMRSALDTSILSEFKSLEQSHKPSRPLKILTVGRLVEKKGYINSLKIVARLNELGCDVKYTIVGNGPLREYMERIISTCQLNNVIMMPAIPQNEVFVKMLKSDLFLLPAMTTESGDQEGIPNVLKEAMYLGLFVVSSYHSGIPELIEDGVHGVLCKEFDVDCFVEKIKQYSNGKLDVKGITDAAYAKVKEDYDIEHWNNKLINIYSTCLKTAN